MVENVHQQLQRSAVLKRMIAKSFPERVGPDFSGNNNSVIISFNQSQRFGSTVNNSICLLPGDRVIISFTALKAELNFNFVETTIT